jgi:nucleotide-binding universal stress UspA family protein
MLFLSQEKATISEKTGFQKLLVAIDGSEISDYALNLAIHVGEVFSSRVDLIYVHTSAIPTSVPAAPLYDPTTGGQILSPTTEIQTSKDDVQKTIAKERALVEHRKILVTDSGLNCEAISISSTDIGGEILKRGNSGGYDLVVVGSRGLSGLKSLILGSVSKKVAKESKISVLVVKNKVEGLPKILVAYDGSTEARNALSAAAELGRKFNGEVDPIGVVSIPLSPEGMVIPDSISKWEKEMNDHVREAETQLKEYGIRKSEGKTIDSPDIPKGISGRAEAGSYDLIVVGNRGYSKLRSFFLGSVASGITDSAKTNVLIVRRN